MSRKKKDTTPTWVLEPETVELSTLTLDPENSRTHDEANLAAIRASLERFGQQSPLIVDKRGTVVVGNGRLQVMRDMGWTHASASVTNLSRDDARAFAIADNHTAELAGWDMEKLAEAVETMTAADATVVDVLCLSDEFLAEMNDAHSGDASVPSAPDGGDDDGDDDEPTLPVGVDLSAKWSVNVGDVWQCGDHRVYCGDTLDVLPTLDEASIHTVVTDPPYGLDFMGKQWDHGVPGVPFWQACSRVLKPGAMLLAFGGTRTYHRLTCAIEDAGFEVRDCLTWLYGSGFPKSLDISKAIDKAAGARGSEGVGMLDQSTGTMTLRPSTSPAEYERPAAVTREAQEWLGWGAALKPAWEPIVLAMKPLDGTFAANALEHGVAGLNIDECRIHGGPSSGGRISGSTALGQGSDWNAHENRQVSIDRSMSQGRWPANLILDEEAGAMLDAQAGDTSRFFYTAKVSRAERGDGNVHPTVKPTKLMRWLMRLTKMPTPGIVLDPFAGSGSTLIAAHLEGRPSIGIELQPEHVAIILERFSALGVTPKRTRTVEKAKR